MLATNPNIKYLQPNSANLWYYKQREFLISDELTKYCVFNINISPLGAIIYLFYYNYCYKTTLYLCFDIL